MERRTPARAATERRSVSALPDQATEATGPGWGAEDQTGARPDRPKNPLNMIKPFAWVQDRAAFRHLRFTLGDGAVAQRESA